MNRLKEIKELKALAEELQLENRKIIRKYKITELASIYNGIGPDSFPEWLRGLVSALHPSLAVVAFIHDIEWHESDGSKKLQLVESAPLHRHEPCPQIREHLSAVRLGRLVFSLRVCRVQKEKVKSENWAVHSRNRRGGRSCNDRRMFSGNCLSGIFCTD